MYSQELELFKEVPGYKSILKAVLKSQIQMLVEQLSSQTDEESVILTASLSDGTFCHLGSSSGKNFLDGREEIKSQFLYHCLNSKTNHTDSGEEQMYMSTESSSPQFDVSPEDRRPAKRQRKSFPVPLSLRGMGLSRGGIPSRGSSGRGAGRGSGRGSASRGRKLQVQLSAGDSNLKRPGRNATSTITRPVEEGSGLNADVVTVKAENFEVDIDLNDKSGVSKDTHGDNIVKTGDDSSHEHSAVQGSGYDEGMDPSGGEHKGTASGLESDTSVNDGLLPIKEEAPDDFETVDHDEPGSSQNMYGVAGPSGESGRKWNTGDGEGTPFSFTSIGESRPSDGSIPYDNQSINKVDNQSKKQTRTYHSLKSMPLEERKAHKRRNKNKRIKAWRERKKKKIGIQAYNAIESGKRCHRQRLKNAELTEEVREEKRRKSRETMRKYRQKRRLRVQQETLAAVAARGEQTFVQLNSDYSGSTDEADFTSQMMQGLKTEVKLEVPRRGRGRGRGRSRGRGRGRGIKVLPMVNIEAKHRGRGRGHGTGLNKLNRIPVVKLEPLAFPVIKLESRSYGADKHEPKYRGRGRTLNPFRGQGRSRGRRRGRGRTPRIQFGQGNLDLKDSSSSDLNVPMNSSPEHTPGNFDLDTPKRSPSISEPSTPKRTPKTRAEIQKDYRDRKKARIGLAAYQEIEKARVQNYYRRAKFFSEEILEARRVRSTERMRAYRQRKKDEARNILDNLTIINTELDHETGVGSPSASLSVHGAESQMPHFTLDAENNVESGTPQFGFGAVNNLDTAVMALSYSENGVNDNLREETVLGSQTANEVTRDLREIGISIHTASDVSRDCTGESNLVPKIATDVARNLEGIGVGVQMGSEFEVSGELTGETCLDTITENEGSRNLEGMDLGVQIGSELSCDLIGGTSLDSKTAAEVTCNLESIGFGVQMGREEGGDLTEGTSLDSRTATEVTCNLESIGFSVQMGREESSDLTVGTSLDSKTENEGTRKAGIGLATQTGSEVSGDFAREASLGDNVNIGNPGESDFQFEMSDAINNLTQTGENGLVNQTENE